MGSDCVVDVASPVVDIEGKIFQRVSSNPRPNFAFECAVESFDFSLCLRVIGSSVDGFDAESNELGLEPTDGFGDIESGSKGVVTEDAVGDAELTEGFPEDVKGWFHADIEARLECNEESGVIIEDGERVNLSSCDFDGSFVVALPELVGLGSFEELDVVILFIFLMLNFSESFQDVCDGSDRGEGQALIDEKGTNFSCSPAVLVSHFEDSFFDVAVGAGRRGVWSSRTIVEGDKRLLLKPSDPFVSGFSTNAKISARLGDGDIQSDHLMNKSETDFRHGRNLPRHKQPPFWRPTVAKRAPPMSLPQLLPMSLPQTLANSVRQMGSVAL